uniref:Derlin-1.1 n=1 Tax=Neospora caninum (strain Liverpool) TaxID=572307 RepID=A0A0F7UE05_NEOCL|nr:TPA: Derlin-1.1 [Neospora caninum Liverpool]
MGRRAALSSRCLRHWPGSPPTARCVLALLVLCSAAVSLDPRTVEGLTFRASEGLPSFGGRPRALEGRDNAPLPPTHPFRFSVDETSGRGGTAFHETLKRRWAHDSAGRLPLPTPLLHRARRHPGAPLSLFLGAQPGAPLALAFPRLARSSAHLPSPAARSGTPRFQRARSLLFLDASSRRSAKGKHTRVPREKKPTDLVLLPAKRARGSGIERPVAVLFGLLDAVAWWKKPEQESSSGGGRDLCAQDAEGTDPDALFSEDESATDEGASTAAATAEAFSSPLAAFVVHQWKATPKLTKGYLSIAAALSLLSSFSSSRHFAPSALLFDAEALRRGRELHRLFSSLFFLGPFSLSSLLSFSFVHAYLGGLEVHFQRTHSPGTFHRMLAFALGCTYSLATLKQIPNDHLLQTVCTFLLYIWSKTHPGGEADVYGLCTIPNEYLPFFFLLQNWILEGKIVAADLWGIGVAAGWLLLQQRAQSGKDTGISVLLSPFTSAKVHADSCRVDRHARTLSSTDTSKKRDANGDRLAERQDRPEALESGKGAEQDTKGGTEGHSADEKRSENRLFRRKGGKVSQRRHWKR